MATERYDAEIGLSFVGGNAGSQMVAEIQRILREADSAAQAGGGILDLKTADQFGERLGAAIRRAMSQDVSSSPLYKLLHERDQLAVQSAQAPATTSTFLATQLKQVQAERDRLMAHARGSVPIGGDPVVKSINGDSYVAKPYADQAQATKAMSGADLAYINATNAATKAREKWMAEIESRNAAERRTAQAEEVASLKGVLATVQAAAKRRNDAEAAARATQANILKEQEGIARANIAVARYSASMDKATAAEEVRQRDLTDARDARNFPVSYPQAALNPNEKVGAAQERVNIAERNVAIAENRLAEADDKLANDRSRINANEVLSAENALESATRGETLARRAVTIEETRAAQLLAKNNEGRLGLFAQFGQGFKGVTEKPFAEQIGQAFKFSVFYGTAYKALFALTQTFTQTVQEGIQFQNSVTELRLATGQTAESAQALANQVGREASQYGFAPSAAVAIAARAQGYYGTTGADPATQAAVGRLSASVVNQVAFASGGQPDQLQGQIAAITQAYGLGYQSQPYIGDLDAYMSRKFGINPGETIGAIAESGTVGRAAGFSPAEVSAIAADIQARTGATPASTGGFLAQIFSRSGEGALTNLTARYGIDQNSDLATQFAALSKVYAAQPDQRDDIAAAFGRGKVQDAVIALLQDYSQVQKAAIASNTESPGALGRATDLRLSDIGGQIQQVQGVLRQFANDLGQSGLLDDLGIAAVTFKNLVEAGDELLVLFNALPRPLRDLAFVVGASVAAFRLAASARETTAGGLIASLVAPRSAKATEEVAADALAAQSAATAAATTAAVDLKYRGIKGFAAEEGSAYRVFGAEGLAGMYGAGAVAANPYGKVHYAAPYFAPEPLGRYAPRGGQPAYIVQTAATNVEPTPNGFLAPVGGQLNQDDAVVHRLHEGESSIVYAGKNTGVTADPAAARVAAQEAAEAAEARTAALRAEVNAARESAVAIEQEATALAAQAAVAQANVKALESLTIQSQGQAEEQYAIYGAAGEKQAEIAALYDKSTAAAEQLTAAQAAATEASQRHAAALLAQVEAEGTLEAVQVQASAAADTAAVAQERLAIAEAEVAAAGLAGAGASLTASLGSALARFGPLAIVAALGFGDFKLNDANKKLNTASSDFNSTIADSSGQDLTTPEGLSARASLLASQAKASKDAADQRMAYVIDLGSKRRDALRDADFASTEQKRLSDAATLVQKHNNLVASSTPGAAISGFDSESLTSSLQAITQSGGTARTEFDALASSLDSAGRAANRVATFDPEVFAATSAQGIFQALVKHPGFTAQTSPNAAGKLLNDTVKFSGLNALVGLPDPIKGTDLSEGLIQGGINPSVIQDRLTKALSGVADPSTLSETKLNAIASNVIGDLPDKIGKKEGFGADAIKKLRENMIATATAALQDLIAGSGGLADNVKLTQDQLTAMVDTLTQTAQANLQALPQTDYKGRVAQQRQLVENITKAIHATAGGSNPEADSKRLAALRGLAEAQFDQLEAARKAAQQSATSAGGVAAAGHTALVAEIQAAVKGRDPDLLAKIIGQSGNEAITIAKQAIRQALAAARAALAVQVAAAEVATAASDFGHGGSYTLTKNPIIKQLQGILHGLKNDPTAGPGGDIYQTGGDVPGADVGSPADQAAAAAQADAIRKQGQIAKARADIVAAHAAMDDAKRGSVAWYNALGQLYQAQQELAAAVVQYNENLYLLGHDITNPLTQARAAARAAAATLRNDRSSGAAGDQIAADKVALEQAQANAESTAFQQRLQSVQTADQLGQISHQKYLNYLQHEHDRLESIKHRTYQQQQELDQVDGLIKSANDALQGEFNFGDIKLPTPYEVQRRLQEVYGTTGGGLNHSSDPFLPGGATNPIHAAQQNNTTILINGADIGAVKKVLKEILGDRATTSTTAARHR